MLVLGQFVGRSRPPDDAQLLHSELEQRDEELGHGSLFQWPLGGKSHDDAADDAEIFDAPDAEHKERAVFIITDGEDLNDFSKIICGLVSTGQIVELVSVGGSTPLQSIQSLPCSVSSSFTAAEPAFAHLVNRASVLFVISDLLGLQHSLIGAGAIDMHQRYPVDGFATLIVLPRQELYALDWIGTMPIDALRSALTEGSPDALDWHVPRIQIAIVTNDRVASLQRLIDSLHSSLFMGDDVSLTISLEQTADRPTRLYVDDLDWPHGHYSIRHRIILGGLLPSIVESWYPTTNHSYGLFLEDDIEVSPVHYLWTKWTLLRYRYSRDSRDKSARLYGISLYQPKLDALQPTGKRPWDAHEYLASQGLPSTTPYRSQIPCSWGSLFFPEIWREAHYYLTMRLYEMALPLDEPWILEDIASNKWSRSWKRFLIELIYSRGYTSLYPNYGGFVSFSTNWVEAGVHVKAPKGKKAADVIAARQAKYGVPLMQLENVSELVNGLPEHRLPDWDDLPVLSLWSELTTDEEMVERGHANALKISTCPDLPERPATTPSYDLHDLICPTPRSDDQAQPYGPPKRKMAHSPFG